MAAKTLLEVFSRYLPDGETRSLMEGTFLSGNMKVDRNLRMIEIHFTSDTLIPKVKLYKLENDICKSYALRSVRLFPIYPKNLFIFRILWKKHIVPTLSPKVSFRTITLYSTAFILILK